MTKTTKSALRGEAVGKAVKSLRRGVEDQQIMREIAECPRYAPLFEGKDEDESFDYAYNIVGSALSLITG